MANISVKNLAFFLCFYRFCPQAAKREKEEAVEAAIAEIARKKLEDKALRKAARAEARARAEQEAKAAMDEAVLADHWTQKQQTNFEAALLACPQGPFVDKLQRWTAIAEATGGKTKNQCLMRYQYLKDYVVKRRNIAQKVF